MERDPACHRPIEPLLFFKPPSAIIGPDEPIRIPTWAGRIEHEAEMAVVIGKRASNVKADAAMSYVLGVTCLNDVTARELQVKDIQYTRAKGFDTFAPLGPCIVQGLDLTAGQAVAIARQPWNQFSRKLRMFLSHPHLFRSSRSGSSAMSGARARENARRKESPGPCECECRKATRSGDGILRSGSVHRRRPQRRLVRLCEPHVPAVLARAECGLLDAGSAGPWHRIAGRGGQLLRDRPKYAGAGHEAHEVVAVVVAEDEDDVASRRGRALLSCRRNDERDCAQRDADYAPHRTTVARLFIGQVNLGDRIVAARLEATDPGLVMDDHFLGSLIDGDHPCTVADT